MPEIKPSKDLRNHYNEISDFCHSFGEPVYITKNGKGDLAVMSIEAFELLSGKFEINSLLQSACEDVRHGKLVVAEELYAEIEAGFDD